LAIFHQSHYISEMVQDRDTDTREG